MVDPAVAFGDVRVGRGRRQAVMECVAAVLHVSPQIGVGNVQRKRNGRGQDDRDDNAAIEPLRKIDCLVRIGQAKKRHLRGVFTRVGSDSPGRKSLGRAAAGCRRLEAGGRDSTGAVVRVAFASYGLDRM